MIQIEERCGSYAGYRVHQRRYQPICEPCRLAAKAYQLNYSITHKEQIIKKNKRLYYADPNHFRAKNRRVRAINFGVKIEFYTEVQVIEIHGYICYLCGEGIDPSAGRHKLENGLHIDHVIPLSRGGDDVLANVRPAHRICNQKKGNR